MSDREIMNAKGFGKQQESFDDVEYKGDLGPQYWKVPFVDEVQEFNEVMGKTNNYEPIIPEKKEWMFVYEFIKEELEEYKEACEKGDIVEVLDALCDITYVSLGNGTLVHGLKGQIWNAYQEVQASNMSKSCATEQEAIDTVTVRSNEQGEECHYETVGDRYIVYRSRDRKVMKSINYFRPNLKQFLKEKPTPTTQEDFDNQPFAD
tara:strand:- start:335 stop:952 length:618 start_codon:yes stop_codon:yes gene_type:complete